MKPKKDTITDEQLDRVRVPPIDPDRRVELRVDPNSAERPEELIYVIDNRISGIAKFMHYARDRGPVTVTADGVLRGRGKGKIQAYAKSLNLNVPNEILVNSSKGITFFKGLRFVKEVEIIELSAKKRIAKMTTEDGTEIFGNPCEERSMAVLTAIGAWVESVLKQRRRACLELLYKEDKAASDIPIPPWVERAG